MDKLAYENSFDSESGQEKLSNNDINKRKAVMWSVIGFVAVSLIGFGVYYSSTKESIGTKPTSEPENSVIDSNKYLYFDLTSAPDKDFSFVRMKLGDEKTERITIAGNENISPETKNLWYKIARKSERMCVILKDSAYVIDLKSKEVKKVLDNDEFRTKIPGKKLGTIYFSPDCSTVAGESDEHVYAKSIDDGFEKTIITPRKYMYFKLLENHKYIFADGDYFCGGPGASYKFSIDSFDKPETVKLFNLSVKKRFCSSLENDLNILSFSDDGKLVAYKDGDKIRLLDTESHKMKMFESPTTDFAGFKLSPSMSKLAIMTQPALIEEPTFALPSDDEDEVFEPVIQKRDVVEIIVKDTQTLKDIKKISFSIKNKDIFFDFWSEDENIIYFYEVDLETQERAYKMFSLLDGSISAVKDENDHDLVLVKARMQQPLNRTHVYIDPGTEFYLTQDSIRKREKKRIREEFRSRVENANQK